MIHLAHPFALVLIPLLAAAAWLKKSPPPSVPHPSLEWIKGTPPTIRARLRAPVLGGLKWIVLVLCALGAARPQHLTYMDQESRGRDLMLVVDISPSMQTSDFESGAGAMQRLEGVKKVLGEFILAREDDRLGLVLFAGKAFLQSPLTRDHSVVESFLSEIKAGAAGDGTAVGDGLSLALKHLLNVPGRTKAVILLTDGASNMGHVSPVTAAAAAKELSIAVHTIGIGAPGASAIGEGEAGPRPQYDEDLLHDVASATGGVFFNAKSLAGLKEVYARIDELEKSAAPSKPVKRVKEYFGFFAAAAFGFYLLYLLVALKLLPRLP